MNKHYHDYEYPNCHDEMMRRAKIHESRTEYTDNGSSVLEKAKLQGNLKGESKMPLDNSIIRRLMLQSNLEHPEIITQEFKTFCHALYQHGKLDGMMKRDEIHRKFYEEND